MRLPASLLPSHGGAVSHCQAMSALALTMSSTPSLNVAYDVFNHFEAEDLLNL